MDVKIEESWKRVLAPEFEKPYFQELARQLHEEKRAGRTIYPPGPLIFNAFNLTPFDQVKVVIIGQDPYHGPGQAEGLSFSVPHGMPLPPSLVNIYKEIETDLGVTLHKDGSLRGWAEQGVFLLNAVLTVRAGQPTSHSRIGWAEFTDAVIRTLSDRREGLVFLLWGNFARSKRELIDTGRHTVLEAAHPSPLARGAFFGCRHFSQTNRILQSQGLAPIDWTK
ncbi:MAG: uracil-DNA glycosylase [Bacteroidales bacterium]|jgi:uracil-DNA glycosylase|nr:uracil-DNA glycosylase [Bacteroidales bacterium]MBQ3743826.1 uracil-DNA glycosylase [Bacteroidales bacterium]MBQ5481961.1 uracil-DNA glycosylase [Bacteroidales bacterium]MBQ5517910.1 uracil-DNA glycosylase [Bacteroidales bacterium]MBR6869143.1 uracil-DNA glycosylase [Bacteroidales bacterium]